MADGDREGEATDLDRAERHSETSAQRPWAGSSDTLASFGSRRASTRSGGGLEQELMDGQWPGPEVRATERAQVVERV